MGGPNFDVHKTVKTVALSPGVGRNLKKDGFFVIDVHLNINHKKFYLVMVFTYYIRKYYRVKHLNSPNTLNIIKIHHICKTYSFFKSPKNSISLLFWYL